MKHGPHVPPLLFLVLVCFTSLSCGRSSHPVHGKNSTPRDISNLLSPILEKSQLPALGAAIVTSDGLEAIGALGVRSWTETQKVTTNDQWHIGSCTKAMTATLAARLVERGLIKWETTVSDVFGATAHPAWKDVQLLWLLSHRSGASLNFDQELWEHMVARGGANREQRRFFVDEALKVPPTKNPNTETRYSNAGFMIAGAMLESVADSSWEDLMRNEVFEPLKMTKTGFGAPGLPGQLDEPLGHVRVDASWSPTLLGPNADNPAASGPAGTIHTTLSDWGQFVAAHLRGERGDQSYLKSTTWQRLHSPGGGDWEYSPGWVVTEQKWAGGKLLQHLGSNGFWLAEASLASNKDFAILIVSNVSDDSVELPFKELLTSLVVDHDSHTK